MDIKNFSYFVALAEEKNFSKAAGKLFMTQSALSQAITKLETQLGTALVERDSRPIKLTYAGEKFLEAAHKILDISQDMEIQIAETKTLQKGRLNIGLSIHRATFTLPKVLPRFKSLYPCIDIHLKEGNYVELESMLLAGDVDLIILNINPLQKLLFQKAEFVPINKEKLLLVVPKRFIEREWIMTDSEKDKYPTIAIEHLREIPFVLGRQGMTLRATADRLCMNSGFIPKILLETYSMAVCCALLRAELAASFLSESIVYEHYRDLSQNTHTFYFKDPNCFWILGVAYNRARANNPAVKEVIKIVKKVEGQKNRKNQF